MDWWMSVPSDQVVKAVKRCCRWDTSGLNTQQQLADVSHQNIWIGEEWLLWLRRSPRRPKWRWPDADAHQHSLIFVLSLRWHSFVSGSCHQSAQCRRHGTAGLFSIHPASLRSPTPGSSGTSSQSPTGKISNTSDEEKQSVGDECDRRKTVAVERGGGRFERESKTLNVSDRGGGSGCV